MNGLLKTLIGSQSAEARRTVRDVFAADFHDLGSFRRFLTDNLVRGNIVSTLMTPAENWSVAAFQALYVACWVHHPLEKGTFMIRLSHVPSAKRQVIHEACKTHLKGRKSSHLSGNGYSASDQWAFLNGYKELLVQYEETAGEQYLFLKAEGHTTGASSIIPHMLSWANKTVTGEGLTASKHLNTLASSGNSALVTVEGRAAENYAKGYKKLLKALNLSGRTITVRQVLEELYTQTKFPSRLARGFDSATSEDLGATLNRFCVMADARNRAGLGFILGGKTTEITPKMISDLRDLARSLIADGKKIQHRVFREIRVRPTEVQASLDVFMAPGQG